MKTKTNGVPFRLKDWGNYEDNVKKIAAHTKTLKAYLKEYEEKEEALNALMDELDGDYHRLSVEIRKWKLGWAMNRIILIEDEIAELKRQFERWT
jgi:predicted RNase H-like nuclease (RuvC/YqgF family)